LSVGRLFGVGLAGSARALALAGALVSPSLLAVEFDNDYDEKPWEEVEIHLPAYPVAASMIRFKVGAIADTTFLIDSESLSVGTDGVIRYTLEVVSPSGARNVSYEGMRCVTAERRFYAFGRSDGTWSKARGNQWVKISGTSNNHHVELFSSYFCPPGSPSVASAEEALAVLRSGGQRSATNP
jgi:hypothetical protein